MDDADFCEYVATVEEADFENEPDQVLAALDTMIDRAPNKDMERALKKLREVISKMSSTDASDATDEEAFNEIMGLMFDPEVIAAGETIETYSTEVCGFPADSTFGDSSTDVSGNEDSADGGGSSTGYIFDDLEAGDVSDAVDRYLEVENPDAYVTSSGLSAMMDTTSVSVDISGDDDVDGVAVCEVVDDAIMARTTDDAYSVSITLDGTEIALHAVGEPCSAA